MSVLLFPIPGSETLSLSLAFRCGASAQTSANAGLFRMLEQILFRGRAISPGAPEPSGAIDSLGVLAVEGGANGERFGISLQVLPDMLGQGLDTLAYLFSGLRITTALSDPNALEEARLASLADIDLSFSDPSAIFEAAMARKLFSTAPWRLDVNGADYIINRTTDAVLKSLAGTWLVPNNAVLVVTGAFSPEDALADIRQAFSDWKKAADPWKAPPAAMPKPGVTRPTLMVYPDPSLIPGEAEIEMRYRAPDSGSVRSIAAELWTELVNQPASRLAKAVTSGMASWTKPSDFKVSYIASRNISWLAVGAGISLTAKGSAADAVLNFKEIVRGNEMYSMKVNAAYFLPGDYAKAKASLGDQRKLTLADPRKAAHLLIDAWVNRGNPSLTAWEKSLAALSSKDISAFADEYFMKNLEVVSIRLAPDEYTARKKSFDSYGFEAITPQKAFWWR